MSRTIGAKIKEAVQRHPDKIFLYEGDRTLTFKQLDEMTDRIASGLLNQGLKRGDHIALLMLNQIEWILTFFAAAKIGVGVVALSPRYRETELSYMLNHSEAKAVVSISQFADFNYATMFENLRKKLNTVESYYFFGEGFEGSLSYEKLLDSANVDTLAEAKEKVEEDDLSIMIFTSGTTGKPKGVIITHKSILASADAQAKHFQVTERDLAIGSLPFNHVGGVTCTIMVALLTCSSITLVPFFNPKHVLSSIERYKATILGAVPTMYLMLFAEDKAMDTNYDSLRLAIIGGSNVEPDLADKINTIIRNASLVNLYGLSESSGACVLSKPSDSLTKVQTTIGVPIGDFEMKVVDTDRNPLPVGEAGELAIRGDCVAKGYYRDKKKTRETFTEEGWLFTGDIVQQDEEGYLSYKGRLQEMFIQGGFNVYPIEVENVITTNDKVQMAAGFGIPDQFLGEIGIYYVVPAAGEKITPEEVIAYCENRLADYKVPRQVIIADSLPMTPAGKINKSQLKKDFLKSKSLNS